MSLRHRKKSVLLLALFAGVFFSSVTALGAESAGAASTGAARTVEMDFSLAGGYRVDQVNWSIAGNYAGTNPNILSELTWDDLEILQLQAESGLLFGNRRRDGYLYHLRGMLGWGSIFSGDNQDSDYAGDNRTLEFSRSNNNADDGDVFDFSAAAGLQFSSSDATFQLTPLVGYSYHEQNLEMTDGLQTVSDQAIANDFFGPGVVVLPPLGPFPGLDSSYDTEWYGPWLGVEMTYQVSERLKLLGNIEYHWYDFEGTANWNLRDDLAHPVSFEHFSDGTGLAFGLKFLGELTRNWSGSLELDYRDWETDAGLDVVYDASGSRSGTRLNEVGWESFSVLVGLTRSF